MKKPQVKKSKKLSSAEEKIVDQAAQQLADIAVQFVDEQNAAREEK